MAMTESFAATAAQVLPVLGFAAVVEFRALHRRARHIDWQSMIDVIATTLAITIWTAFMIYAVEAESLCLDRLQDLPVPDGAEVQVRRTITAGLVLLIVMPILSIAAEMLTVGRRWLERRFSSSAGSGSSSTASRES